MNSEPPNLETELREMLAAPLDDALLARLEAATDGSLTKLNPDELRFESFLRESVPARLDPAHLAELQAVFREIPFPVNEKIVLFPGSNGVPAHTGKRPMWAAAAAVALIGAATAFMLPTGNPARETASAPPRSVGVPAPAKASNLIPAGFNRGVSQVKEEGVVWKSNTQPHSLMRVDYIDRITMKDEIGRTFQVEQPRVRYLMVPARTD